MCNSYGKKQRRHKAKSRASKDKPARKARRDRLIAYAVMVYKAVLGALYPEGYPTPETPA